MQVPLVGRGIVNVEIRHIALLEVPAIALRNFQYLAEPGDSPRTVSAVALVVAVAEAVLLLGIFY